VDEAKPFDIPKREVWEAFKKKANEGAAGVDGQSIADFEADLSNNLYKLWNRLSSGSYFPPPVRRVDIPKANGGTRPLGIPTVADRVAQEVARRYLEPRLEPVFHTDSYGYRPGRSAIDAVRQARQRCWRYDWVLDIDVKGYFDSIDWELMLKGGPSTYGLRVGAALCRALTEGSGADGGRQRRAANCGDAAGWGDKPTLGEPVPALRLRHVDGAELSSHPPRRRRHCGPRLPTAVRPASWCCIRRRRRSSIARMRTGVAIFRTRRSTFSGSHSELAAEHNRILR
jgi:hypothetical protein